MTFIEAKQMRDSLESEYRIAYAPLKLYPRNAMGLVSEEIRLKPDYRIARKRTEEAFQKLRQFNSRFVKEFKKELAAKRAVL